MATIRRKPGAYVERVKSAPSIKLDASTSIAGIVGLTLRGVPNKAIRLTSWAQFENNFGKGYSDVFAQGYVADAVEGFFLNGGSELYVVRVLGNECAKATATIQTANIEAIEEGAWGNDLSVDIAKVSEEYNVTITLQGNVVEEFKGLKADDLNKINESEFIRVTGTLAEGSDTLAEGSDGTINSTHYIKALKAFDIVREINQIMIPGVSELGVQEGLVDYCNLRGRVFPIVDAPCNATYEEVLDFYAKLSGYRGAIYHPWVQKKDAVTGNLKNIPPSGHVAGLYSRTDNERGVHKAPAGVEANLRGIVGVVEELDDATIGSFNANNINCIIPKTGRGIVVWGARLLNEEGDRKFVSDLRLDDYVETSIESGTEWAVFEPIDEQLFNELEGQLKTFFNTLMAKGSIKGSTPEEAYYVICDETINPDPESSTVEIEVGYAKKKPAEFVVTRISHMRNV